MATSGSSPPTTGQTGDVHGSGQIGFVAAVSIGIGGMVGAGILNLQVLFDAVLIERHVGRAAKRLHPTSAAKTR